MPRFPTMPTLFDECKTISIADLKRWGYLKPNQIFSGVITWSRGEGANKKIIGKIGIATFTSPGNNYLELDYSVNGEPVNYKVQLITTPANIGKGLLWFFICPRTSKRCRKLHLVSKYFYHRSAFTGCYYEKQVQSKYWRFLDNSALGKEFEIERIYKELHKKHFKTHYRGKPTKKYQFLMIRLKKAERPNNIPFDYLFPR